jgi:3-keto-5-aminohexanoate cleavage enzyme
MAQLDKGALDAVIEEAKKVFDGRRDPIDNAMGKKLIINIAASGGFVDRRHNPNLPMKTDEVAREVKDAYNAGAAMWHFQPRNIRDGMIFMPLEERLQVHQEWCDSVFAVAPDVITDVGAIYMTPPRLNGRVVDEQSILAETRIAPLIDPLTQMGPRNRYVEIAIILPFTGSLGPGTNLLGFNNKAGVVSEVKYLQSKGIRVELSPFQHVDLLNVKEWVIDSGIAEPPVILDTLLGVHNTPSSFSGIEAFEFLFTWVRMLPKKGVLWQALIGGRYWMPMTVMSIILGADVVRIGMEDAVNMYPHRNDYIRSNGEVVEAIAGIARYLGREVATPAEARKMLCLPVVE